MRVVELSGLGAKAVAGLLGIPIDRATFYLAVDRGESNGDVVVRKGSASNPRSLLGRPGMRGAKVPSVLVRRSRA